MSDAMHVACPHCDTVNRLPVERDARGAKCGRCSKRLFEGKPVALNGERFRRHVKADDIPVIVDFWAAWCGPCRAMAPIFDKAAAELEPRARFAKVDVDAEPELANEFGVRGIPALFLFRNGKVADQHSGLADLGLLRGWVGG